MLELHESRELTEATMKYVARLKLMYHVLNERYLYGLVHGVGRQRVEEAQKASGDR